MNKAMYLKINRSENFSMRNLSRWIDVSYLMGVDCYILCDRKDIISSIKREFFLAKKCCFIESDRGITNTEIVDEIANKNWKNAAYAHLTTFTHAISNGYDYFWNIDADDTMMCLSTERITELLNTVEKYAEIENVDCFSLDMWRTKWKGKHWSFGVTYTNAGVDWMGEIGHRYHDEKYRSLESGMNYNIDCFFYYLNEVSDLKISTFYVENLKFIHYSEDMFRGLISSAFYHWRNGKLIFPIMRECVGLRELSSYDIYPDIVRLDIGIADNEARDILTYYSRDEHEFRGYVDWSRIINKRIFDVKKEAYMKEFDGTSQIVCFGIGNCFDNHMEKISAICNLKYVCDNDKNKWGKIYGDGVLCISPEKLMELENVLVIITVYSKTVAENIAEQLEDIGIKKYDYIDNFIRCVE